jgi:hypothetical protein
VVLLSDVVLAPLVDDGVLSSVVGGTEVLVTSSVVDVLGSVVVSTGVVV